MIPIRNKILVHLVNVSFTLLWSSGHLWSSADLNAGNRQVHSRSMGIVDAFIHSLSNRTTITSSFGTTTTILASSQVLPDFPISTARNTEWSESNSETIRPGADGEQQPAVPCRAAPKDLRSHERRRPPRCRQRTQFQCTVIEHSFL